VHSSNHIDTPWPDDSIIHGLDQIINEAIRKGASDIHFEPYEQHYRIRYRLDGLLKLATMQPQAIALRMVARLKLLAHLDISKKRIPQDGGFKLSLANQRSMDIRVSSCPLLLGEKIVLRLLDEQRAKLGMESLGLSEQQKKQLLTALRRPEGMILVTGPTGSGKTVTLYTALNHLNTMEKNISAVEDPVEIIIQGINQVNVNAKAGLYFSTVVRAFLRQDPDIIMVGEIRDQETAEIAIKAAQTGHLVLSTLHTNNARDSINRLIHLGLPAFQLTETIHLIIAQRLLRRLCEHCKIPCTPLKEAQRLSLGLSAEEAQAICLFRAGQCAHCHQGYRGRTGFFEIMSPSNATQCTGHQSLYQAGLEKVKAGITSMEELQRVIVIYEG
jgi:type IV pilus assembly protein PilB